MKIVYFLGAIILLFAHPKLVAQENQRSNIVKFNFLSAVGRTANVEYERVLFGKFSLNGNIAVYPKQSFPFKSLLNRVTDNSSIIDVAHMSVFSIALEGRYYVNRKSVLDGVYVAPFVKYSEAKVSTEVPYGASNSKHYLPLSGSLNAITGGLVFGVQWIFPKRITLDWRIIGLGYGSSRGSLEGKRELTVGHQKEIRDQLEKLEDKLPLVKLKNEVNENGVRSTMDGSWIGVRAGVSLGYSF